MNKPQLTKGVTTITLGEHPSDWTVNNIVGDNTQTSLYGTDFIDVNYRKYEYVLTWDAMWSTDYEALEDMINDAIDDGSSLTFTYPKFPSSSSGVEVVARLSSRDRAGGSGESYYSKVVLTLKEVNKQS